MNKAVKFLHPYITQKTGVCGGVPIIRNTRIRIIDIAIEYEYLGLAPDEILESHPHLRLEQIHDALSYYYENREEIDREIKSRLKEIAKFQKVYEPKLEK